MSVVLHEGVVATPRNLDQGGRRSVPRDCARGVFSRTAVPKQRADLDTSQLLTALALSPQLGINSNAVAKDHFALPAGEPCRRRSTTGSARRAPRRPRDHIADRALPSVAECANAFITHDGLPKRLWRQPNNPIAPRKFPSNPIAPREFPSGRANRHYVKICRTAFCARAGPGADAIGLHSRHPGRMRGR